MRIASSHAVVLSALAATVTLSVACSSILGFEDFTDARDGGPGPVVPVDGGPDVTADTGPDHVAPPDTGPDDTCTPLATASCAEDANGNPIPGMPNSPIGICKPGTKTCSASGKWGPCVGTLGPKARDCDATGDNDCDGKPDNTIDDVCQCNATHPSRTVVGGPKNCECTETCGADDKWVACTPPTSCDCTPAATRPCTGTSGCAGGTQTCAADRTWGTCNNAPPKASYCQDHDNDGVCSAAVLCSTVCPGALSTEWKTNCAATDCDDNNVAVKPGAPASCTPTNVCNTGAISCTTATATAPSVSTCNSVGYANGKACGTNLTCNNGACNVCTTGYTLCGSTCVNLKANDANNCGQCGATCGGSTCATGVCTAMLVGSANVPIVSVAATKDAFLFSTATSVTRIAAAGGAGSTVLATATNPIVRAVSDLFYVLDATHLYVVNSAGSIISTYTFPPGLTHATFSDFKVATNTVYAIAGYSIARFSISGSSLTGYNEIFSSGGNDATATGLAIASENDVYSSFGGLGSGLFRCNATSCTTVSNDNFVDVHIAYGRLVYRDGGSLVSCIAPLTSCVTQLTTATRIVADDGHDVFVQLGSSLVSVTPGTAANIYHTVLTNMSNATADNDQSYFAIGGDFIYFVRSDKLGVLRTRKY